MDPVSMIAIGTLVSGVAAFKQSQYASAVATANAKQATLNARLSSEVGQENAMDASKENAVYLAAQTAAQGGSGLDLNSPTAVAGRQQTTRVGQIEQGRIIEASRAQSANYLTQSNQFNAEAQAEKTAGYLNLAGSAAGAYGTYLGGASPVSKSAAFVPKPRTKPNYRPFT